MSLHLELGLVILSVIGGVVFPASVSSLTGIQFGDNGGEKYVTEENGVALATTQVC